MADSRSVRISKLMSLILRHKPEQFDVVLDAEGYALLADVLHAITMSIPDVTLEDIRRVVDTIDPDKTRFSIAGAEIRANYGHSLKEKISQKKVEPPDVLLHGTSEATVQTIREMGLRPMRRQYVHLTTNRELAARVGGRHGKAHILEIDAHRAAESGIPFYRANDQFWLADFVPPQFIR